MKDVIQKSSSCKEQSENEPKKVSLCTTAAVLALSILNPVAVAAGPFDDEVQPRENKGPQLRTIAPDKAKFVFLKKPQLKAGGSDGTEVACCTDYSVHVGGTGCATFQDEDGCPGSQFQVECGKTGCW